MTGTVYGVETEELQKARKGDWRKALLAAVIQEETTVKLDWISEQLGMGARAGVCELAAEARERLKSDASLRRKKNEIEKISIFNG